MSRAESSRRKAGHAVHADELSLVAGHVFLVSDSLGNIMTGEAHGLFAADTRYLSRYELSIEPADIILLSSGVVGRGRSEIYATNSGRRNLPPHSIEVHRSRELAEEFVERTQLINRGEATVQLCLMLHCDSDFADIFEVRTGPERDHTRRLADWQGQTLVLRDRRRHQRQTHVSFQPAPDAQRGGRARFDVSLAPGESWDMEVRVAWVLPEHETSLPVPIARPMDEEELVVDWLDHVPDLDTDDPDLELAYRQSISDLAMLEMALDSGHPIPAAGLPWYLAIFGRDSIITSMQCLLTGRRQAYGTLRTLAAYQATEDDAFRDAEPGKIAHEVRFGELAVSDHIPHARYYGTADATPLWIMLLKSAVDWSGRIEIVRELLASTEAALAWIDRYGDLDGDGLYEYQRRSKSGLRNQGWKDSWDSLRFADGRYAEGAIALIEVQGYVYAAKHAAADLYESLGEGERAGDLRKQADALKDRIHEAFWMSSEGFYALALDGEKRQVDSVTSNPGHLLWCGAIQPQYAEQVANRLMSDDLFSGWGIRTMSAEMAAFNPFSYHNGSVWPHDNSIIVAGLARYGYGEEAMRVINAMIDASSNFEHHRLPELFCGYDRGRTPFPVNYPVACSPQAWASGAVIHLLQTMAGIAPDREELRLSPLTHGRRLRLDGVRYHGNRFRLRCEPGHPGAEPITASSGVDGSPDE